MFEDIPGRLIGGALWGLGAGIVLRLINGNNQESQTANVVKPLTRTLVKGYVLAADGLSRLTAEARETLTDLYAEAQAERQHAAAAGEPAVSAGEGSPKHRAAATAHPRSRRASAATASTEG